PARQRDEALNVRKQDRDIVVNIGDGLIRTVAQALDDRSGENVVEQRLGLRLGTVGEGKRIARDRRAEREGRHRRGDIKLDEEVRLDRHDPDREQEPRRDVKPEAEEDGRDREPRPVVAEDEKAGGGADDQVDLDAGIAAEKRHEREQRRALGGDDHQPRRVPAEPMSEWHAYPHRGEHEVDDDDPAVPPPIGHRVVGRVTGRGDRDQPREGVEDFQAPAHPGRVAGRAEFEQAAKSHRPCPLTSAPSLWARRRKPVTDISGISPTRGKTIWKSATVTSWLPATIASSAAPIATPNPRASCWATPLTLVLRLNRGAGTSAKLIVLSARYWMLRMHPETSTAATMTAAGVAPLSSAKPAVLSADSTAPETNVRRNPAKRRMAREKLRTAIAPRVDEKL